MIQRLFITGGDENPQVEDDFGVAQNMEILNQKGFISIPDVDDEVIVLSPYGNELDRVVAGVVEAAKYGVSRGDRLIITDNCSIKLSKDGTINIKSNGIINIEGTQVNLNGDIKINGQTPQTI